MSTLPFFGYLLGSLLVSLGYVGILYIDSSITGLTYNRNDPLVIKRRAVLVSIYSVMAVYLVNPDPWQVPSFVSYLQTSLISLLKCVLLFLGPIYVDLHSGTPPQEPSAPVLVLRNLLVAPITEELIYRYCVYYLWSAAGISPPWIVLLGPLLFGVAHCHHYFQLRQMRYSASVALQSVLFQVVYTSLFGSFAMHTFVQTHNILACILQHAFCNYMGFPDLSWTSGKHAVTYGVVLLLGVGLFAASLYV